jgi:hypothetical protein
MKYTYTKKTKTNWISYILEITGWETDFGEVFSEVHFTMPKDFTKDSNMANCPHVTITTKDGWILHRYEVTKGKHVRKYNDETRRLVKKGTQSYTGNVIPASSNETLIVGYLSADLSSMKRP